MYIQYTHWNFPNLKGLISDGLLNFGQCSKITAVFYIATVLSGTLNVSHIFSTGLHDVPANTCKTDGTVLICNVHMNTVQNTVVHVILFFFYYVSLQYVVTRQHVQLIRLISVTVSGTRKETHIHKVMSDWYKCNSSVRHVFNITHNDTKHTNSHNTKRENSSDVRYSHVTDLRDIKTGRTALIRIYPVTPWK